MAGIWVSQVVYCQACGKQFKTVFTDWDGRVCSKDCFEKYQELRAAAVGPRSHAANLISSSEENKE